MDNLIDSQTYYAQWIDDIKPALSVQVTENVASEQTATITATDAGSGVAAYYIGKQNPATTSVNFTNSASGTYTGSITSDSTWYFAVKDAAGNMAVTKKDFCKVMFGLASGETVSPSTIVIEKGKQITLPNPTKAGYSFKGWSNVQNPDVANIATFFTKVKVDNSMTVYPCFVDDIAPTFTATFNTGGVGANGTITITGVTEQGSGVAGYYIGTSNPANGVTWGSTTSATVNASGTWYAAVKDKAGNITIKNSTYYSLTLNADGATNYTTNTSYIKSGTTVNLPTGLTKSGYKADTWTGGISSITMSGNGSLSPVWYRTTFNLTVSAGNNTYNAFGSGTYAPGTVVTIGFYKSGNNGRQYSMQFTMPNHDVNLIAETVYEQGAGYSNGGSGGTNAVSLSYTVPTSDYYFASVQGAENMQSGSYLSMGGSTGNWNPVSYLSAGQIISTYYWGAATTYKLEGTLILSVIRFRQY